LIPEGTKSDIIIRVRSGQSIRQVAQYLGIPLSTTYHHGRSFCNHQSRIELNKLGQGQLGYLLGMFVGDGSLIRDKPRGEFLVKIALDRRRDLDIIQFVALMFEKAGKKVNFRTERGMILIRVWSKIFYEIIKDYVQFERNHLSHHHTKILLRTQRWTREFALGFIGGLIDSDGHVVSNRKGGHYGALVTTSSCSLKRQLCSLCNALGINVTSRVQPRDPFQGKPLHSMYIRSPDLHALCWTLLSVKHSRFHGGPGRT